MTDLNNLPILGMRSDQRDHLRYFGSVVIVHIAFFPAQVLPNGDLLYYCPGTQFRVEGDQEDILRVTPPWAVGDTFRVDGVDRPCRVTAVRVELLEDWQWAATIEVV